MRARFIAVVIFLLGAAIVLMVWRRDKQPRAPASVVPASRLQSRAASNTPASSDVFGVAPTNSARTPKHILQAFERVREFVSTAGVYQFDPTLAGHREESPRPGFHYVLFETPTHVAEVLNNKVVSIVPLIDGSNPRHDLGMTNRNAWPRTTATWTKEEAIKQTMLILKRLKATDTLNEVEHGAQEFQALPITAKTQEGERLRVVAFPSVRLYDTSGILRVRAEFRMGPAGVLGLTEWSSR